jgi:OOP family OmpA-OmpF porin
MKSKKLCAVIALTLGAAMSAHAGDWDGRWYFAPWLGANNNDSSRDTNNVSVLVGLGIGKYVAPNTTVDLFVDRVSRNRDAPFTSTWANDAVGVSVRYYFGSEEGWQPYLMAGVAADHHGAFSSPTGGNPRNNFGWDPALQVGVGMARSYSHDVRFRAELAYRYDMDGNSIPTEDNYGDVYLSLGLMWGFGQAAVPPAPPPATVATTTTTTTPPPAQKPAPPPAAPANVVIDLRGVNFRFDYPKKGEHDINNAGLVEGSIALLDQAVDVLKRYPNVRVEVDGHTDSIGTDQYNQGLSERRATVVYEYLTAHGIERSRLLGPKGFGESKPIDTNKTKEGRARNRRTELVVQ